VTIKKISRLRTWHLQNGRSLIDRTDARCI
jgi:hypothetical protein